MALECIYFRENEIMKKFITISLTYLMLLACGSENQSSKLSWEGSCTVTYDALESFYGDLVEQTRTFSDRTSAEVWISHNRLCGNYRCDGEDERWAAHNISLSCSSL